MQKLRPWEVVTQLVSGRLEIQVHCWLQSLLFFIAPNCFQKSREELGRRRMVKLDRLASLVEVSTPPSYSLTFYFLWQKHEGIYGGYIWKMRVTKAIHTSPTRNPPFLSALVWSWASGKHFNSAMGWTQEIEEKVASFLKGSVTLCPTPSPQLQLSLQTLAS